MIGSQVAKLAFGALFWILAARLFSVGEIGLAAGAVAMIAICINLAFLGAGASVIRFFPDFRHDPHPLLKAALRIVLVGSVSLGGLLLVVARWAFGDLSIVASGFAFSLAFVGGCILGTMVVLGDQISVAMWRGREALVRALCAGVVMIATLAAVAPLRDDRGPLLIVFSWVLGALVAVAINIAQLRSTIRRRHRVGLPAIRTRDLLRVGVPNHVVSLLDIAPASVLTVIVAELLQPESAAYWYTLWMAATAVFIIPGTFGLTLFAGAVEARGLLSGAIRRTVRSTLAISGLAACVLAALADQVLRVFGPQYADAGATPLRLLMVGVIPLAFIHAYLGVCRATDKLTEAAAAIFLGGVLGIGGAAVAGTREGLVGVAAAWLTAQISTGTWAGWRLRALVRDHGRQARLAGEHGTSRV